MRFYQICQLGAEKSLVMGASYSLPKRCQCSNGVSRQAVWWLTGTERVTSFPRYWRIRGGIAFTIIVPHIRGLFTVDNHMYSRYNCSSISFNLCCSHIAGLNSQGLQFASDILDGGNPIREVTLKVYFMRGGRAENLHLRYTM